MLCGLSRAGAVEGGGTVRRVGKGGRWESEGGEESGNGEESRAVVRVGWSEESGLERCDSSKKRECGLERGESGFRANGE